MGQVRSGKIKTRKEHMCWGCRQVLPKGTMVMTVVTADGGQVATARWCDICDRVWADHGRELDPYRDGIDVGSIIDECKDWYDEAKAVIAQEQENGSYKKSTGLYYVRANASADAV